MKRKCGQCDPSGKGPADFPARLPPLPLGRAAADSLPELRHAPLFPQRDRLGQPADGTPRDRDSPEGLRARVRSGRPARPRRARAGRPLRGDVRRFGPPHPGRLARAPGSWDASDRAAVRRPRPPRVAQLALAPLRRLVVVLGLRRRRPRPGSRRRAALLRSLPLSPRAARRRAARSAGVPLPPVPPRSLRAPPAHGRHRAAGRAGGPALRTSASF